MFNKKLLKRIEELDIKTKDIEIEIFKLKNPNEDLFIIEKTNDNIVEITCKLTNGEILVDTNMG